MPAATRTSLEPPRVPGAWVEREALVRRLRGDSATRLVLLCAPAGSGKTMAMLQLRRTLAQQGWGCPWVTLEEVDNEVERLVRRLAHATQDEPDGVLGQAVFVDELEVLSNGAAIASIARFIDQLPTDTLVVLGSRTLPEVGLARLRARGQLVEAGAADLRFTFDESSEFFRLAGGAGGEDAVRHIHAKSGGWPAALRLASIALARHPAPAQLAVGLSGAASFLSVYFAEEIFHRQPPPVQAFLLQSAVLERLNADLCDAILGRHDSHAFLEELDRARLFEDALHADGARQYHPLFREFLQSRLAEQEPGRRRLLHLAASDVFQTRGQIVDAISHAFAAQELGRALPLLHLHAERLLRAGHARLLQGWLDQVPADALTDYPQLRLVQVWAVKLTRGAREALHLLEGIDAGSLGSASVRAHMNALQPMLLGLTDRITEARALALKNLLDIPPQEAFAHGMVQQTLASTSMILGYLSDARAHADAVRLPGAADELPLQFALAEAIEGAINLMQGRLKEAVVRLRAAAGGHLRVPQGRPDRFAFPSVWLAYALYEAGEDQRPLRMLTGLLPLMRSVGLPDQLITSHALVARLLGRQGEREASLQVLDELESTGHRLGLPRVVASARLERAQGLLDRGRFEAARDEIEHAGDDLLWRDISSRWFIANDVCTRQIALVRWQVRSGRAAQAIDSLVKQLAQAEHSGRTRRALTLRILLAEAKFREGELQSAQRHFAAAFALGREEGLVSAFSDEGAVVQRMLAEASLQEEDPPVAAKAQLTEPLTRQEVKVLRLVAQGHSNDVIAAQLFVSRSTVRTHLRSISAKLQARGRTHAVAVARQLHLIP